MQVLPRLEMIKEGFVEFNGKKYPVLDIDVVAGEYSEPSNLAFDWVTSDMTDRMIRFKITFKTAMFVSTSGESDTIKVTFRDPYLFVSTNDMPLRNKKRRRRRR